MMIEAVNTSLMKMQVKWFVLTVTDAFLQSENISGVITRSGIARGGGKLCRRPGQQNARGGKIFT